MHSRTRLKVPRVAQGLIVAAVAIAVVTLLLFPLRGVAPVVSLGVVYLLAVLLVASVWGLWLGLATAVASAMTFNFFHIPHTGRFTVNEGENWVALAVFLVAAAVSSTLAQRARLRAEQAEEHRREADLALELARLLLRGDDLATSLPAAAGRLAAALGVPSAEIRLEPGDGEADRFAFPLREGNRQLGTLLLPREADEPALRRVQDRIVPSLEALLAAALERDELLGDVVETRALRHSDVVKTALLRAVSHDLRSPLTAILTAVEPLAGQHVDDAERRELAADVRDEAHRLSRLIDQLLDLSRLEAKAAEPRLDWVSVEEVVRSAVEDLGAPEAAFRVTLDKDTPLVRADAAQLERVFANVLENSLRHSGGHPVLVRGGGTHNRVMVRIVDRGPGMLPPQADRIFEPFYRSGGEDNGHRGSGLGLAIARGFLEANGGRIWVESLPGQSTTFVVELPA
jgi:two-component system sensor histidine kinase KdpD